MFYGDNLVVEEIVKMIGFVLVFFIFRWVEWKILLLMFFRSFNLYFW